MEEGAEVQKDSETTSKLIWPLRNYTREATRMVFWFLLHCNYASCFWGTHRRRVPTWALGRTWERLRTASVIPKIDFKIIWRLSYQRTGILPALILSLTRTWGNLCWLEITEWNRRSLMSSLYCLIRQCCWTVYFINVWPFAGMVLT